MGAALELPRTEALLPAAWIAGKAAACASLLGLWHFQDWRAAQHAVAAVLLAAVVAEPEADRLLAQRIGAQRRAGSTRVAGDALGWLLLLALRPPPARACAAGPWAWSWAAAWALAAACACAGEAAARDGLPRGCWAGVVLLGAAAATSPCVAESVHGGSPALAAARGALFAALTCARHYAPRACAVPNALALGWVLVASVRALALAACCGALLLGALARARAPGGDLAPAAAPGAAGGLHCLEADFVRQMQAMEASHAPPERERRRLGLFAP